MSHVELRVELPAYSHSFVIQVPLSSTILDVKQEILRSCIGAPRPDGQKIVWRGRFLVDHEKVQDLWKTSDESRVVHLAVHPSAWSSEPPSIPQTPAPTPTTSFQLPPLLPRQASTVHPSTLRVPTQPTTYPLAYVLYKHQSAIFALTQSRVAQPIESLDLRASQLSAMQITERHGWLWPSVLDVEFPPATEGGLKYERVVIDGQPYLTLLDPTETPTPLQVHALKVLTYTFSLLSIPPAHTPITHTIPLSQMPIPPHVNELLQQLGLPQIRVAQNQNQNPNNQNVAGILPGLREIPIRPLLAPLMMLAFRTLLLLYFVAPARKPVFGFLLIAWVLYEGWQPIRNGFLRGWRRAVVDVQEPRNQPARPADNAEPNGQPNPLQNNQRPPVQPRAVGPQRVAGIDQAGDLLNRFSNVNLDTEERAMSSFTTGIQPEEPGFWHKVATFLTLLVMTIHPAVWNRRRVVLSQREGRIRTEANARQVPPTPPPDSPEEAVNNERQAQIRADLVAQHARRPLWVRNYVERVIENDWMDDSD